ncbi:MAG: response regulator [Actinomycetota bacterium]|nr:response regulator [Actinomycetota bacterium]
MARRRILIVDDDPDLVRILSVNLMADGFDVSTAFDGVSAVMCAHRDQPDLIVLDIKMPAGDGFSVVERLKSSNRTFTIPIVFLSAMPKEDMEEKALKAGALRYFPKPFDLDVFMNYIKERLGVSDMPPVTHS